MRRMLYAYNNGSHGARELASALGVSLIRHRHSRYVPRQEDKIINWGGRDYNFRQATVLNRDVRISNKLAFFQACQSAGRSSPRIPRWTIDRATAHEYLVGGSTVLARKSLTGHSGYGIIIVPPGSPLPDAPLYVEYIPKDMEFRVHIMKGEVIDVQRKIRDPDREPTDWKVRSHDNGFIFIRGGVNPNEDVLEQARRAVVVARLDFCAVDVICKRNGTAFVLEINTAPGLENTTITKYADAFRKFYGF